MNAKPFLALLAIFGSGAVLFADEKPTTSPAAPRPVALDFKPIAHFQAHCANCHGNYGSFYGDGFAADLSDADLQQTVKEMCAGPGQAPLKGEELAAEVAYHRSLARGTPFVIVTKRAGGQIEGEVTDGATVQVGGKPATVEGTTFRAAAPPDAPVVASKGGKSTTLAPTDGPFSQSGGSSGTGVPPESAH